MKEIRDIIKAYHDAGSQGKKSALATVVHVEGSSYRRPGARMLVTEDGQLTGAISGGCLEGDALRKALLAITQGQNKLVTYDTTDEDDAKFGVQLGCNGIVHILFEPIHEDKKANAIYLLEQLTSQRQNAVLVTFFSLHHTLQLGTSLLYRDGVVESLLPGILRDQITGDARQALQSQSSSIKVYQYEEKQLNGFIEFIPPPVSIVIVGAGNDVQPLVEIAFILGWHITVVDGRATHATIQRFPKATKVLVAKPGQLLQQVGVDAHTVFLLMTHNYNYDLALLREMQTIDCSYIGILGPKKKMDRMFEELSGEGAIINEEQLSKIYSPVGLDIGAETAEEIAVSIVAEIKAVLAGRSGTSLKCKETSIHSRPAELSISNE
ncbi:MAG: alanine dehydrogenase [Flavisolibacter sp.]|nr:alanine dehydrogenase [Flavisolibacter sp.]